MKKLFPLCALLVSTFSSAESLRIATFNVSMDATNYVKSVSEKDANTLEHLLAEGNHPQIKNVAEIIQRVRPDILLLNEFDYIDDPNRGIQAFQKHFLNKAQNGQQPINYPYFYTAPVNTGVASAFDLNNDGKKQGNGGDALGFGFYPGHYGMVLLSQYPIDMNSIRTLQHFKWKDMPGAKQVIDPDTNKPWYSQDELAILPLSSKSHWDIPVNIKGKTVHVLALHPTPPVFDGKEDRNGHRNHDEIRLIADYVNPLKSHYIYDDKGVKGGLSKEARFVIMGDLNASDVGDKHRPGVIEQLTESTKVNNCVIPVSKGGAEADTAKYSDRYTAAWGARVDYVLPSKYGIHVHSGGVYWPAPSEEGYELVATRKASSDHRLVWLDVNLTDKKAPKDCF